MHAAELLRKPYSREAGCKGMAGQAVAPHSGHALAGIRTGWHATPHLSLQRKKESDTPLGVG